MDDDDINLDTNRPPRTPSSNKNNNGGRIRNRHNAIYGQYLPNSFNSPHHSQKVFGNSNNHLPQNQEEMKQNVRDKLSKANNNNNTASAGAGVGGASASNSHRNNKIEIIVQEEEVITIEEDDDLLFANLDLEGIVEQEKKRRISAGTTPLSNSHNNNNSNRKPLFILDTNRNSKNDNDGKNGNVTTTTTTTASWEWGDGLG